MLSNDSPYPKFIDKGLCIGCLFCYPSPDPQHHASCCKPKTLGAASSDVIPVIRNNNEHNHQNTSCNAIQQIHPAVEQDIRELITMKPYPQPNTEEAMYKIIQEFLKDGLITESNSPYAAPAILVKKKDGNHRLVIDYKKLNLLTIKDSSPLPNMADTIRKLGRENCLPDYLSRHPREQDDTLNDINYGIAKSMIKPFFYATHNDPMTGGHFSTDRTFNTIKTQYWWPRMRYIIIQHIKACMLCQQYNYSRQKKDGQLRPISPPQPEMAVNSREWHEDRRSYPQSSHHHHSFHQNHTSAVQRPPSSNRSHLQLPETASSTSVERREDDQRHTYRQQSSSQTRSYHSSRQPSRHPHEHLLNRSEDNIPSSVPESKRKK
ncbi:unnamed protein product [Didymodactylos carnosus]|uniref:Integrase zinc-binding domain-containing protein n=1 Tax=Didymodactylos carnosus TaxID=1234261 RepID=A0A814FD32_9BILA|nr:unnamed protein product [Didymodactylos carnosus]CAF0979044.1 unnamed protein product [Didymodactylos carnosus]CAF3698639.1 unnamed protein product [Didymodactylos carnosus]CAF3751778.1 unnamed protein product [Didymodactylos carnosus]